MRLADNARAVRAQHAGRRAAARSIRLVWLAAVGLTACATAPPRRTLATGSHREAKELGPWPKLGCFQVSLVAPDRYRFVIDDVEYPDALGAGRVGIIVYAPELGDLKPRPIELPRLPRLVFSAEGEASGAFVLMLFLIDAEGRAGEPTRLETICTT